MIEHFTGDHHFLSNFYPSPIRWAGCYYPTAEHLYQARKTGEPAWSRKIAAAATPTIAKRLGRQVPLLTNWEAIKLDVMRDVVTYKFRDNPELADKLLNTDNQILVEGNTWCDQYWGDCRCSKHQSIAGRNALGIILMSLRLDLHRYIEDQPPGGQCDSNPTGKYPNWKNDDHIG